VEPRACPVFSLVSVTVAPGIIPPCVLPIGPEKVCTQILTFQGLCETEGGTWYGNLQNCCQVQKQDPTVSLLPHDAWTMRDVRWHEHISTSIR